MKKIIFFASVTEEGVGSGVGSGSICQMYGSGDRDPDPHQNATDPQYRVRYILLPALFSEPGGEEPVPQQADGEGDP
jgi:hypothetical protein